MNTGAYRESATIYEFPKNPRNVINVRRSAAELAVKSGLMQAYENALGGAWYHEAALRQMDQATDA